MLLLLLLYLSRNTLNTALVAKRELSPAESAPSPACLCPANERSEWDILWSCLVTIVACSWVSVHPNMLAPNTPRCKVLRRRAELMFWSIMAPEFMILWASRQWMSARKIASRYQELGWTKTHGYFLQMGGFMLFNNGSPDTVLSPRIFQQLYETGWIDFPTITEEEIMDRSKADSFSKAIVFGQTTWFIIQCVARAAQRLEITPLELLTLALAALNGVMYFLWWSKPIDVGCYVPVYLLSVPKDVPSIRACDPGQDVSVGHRLHTIQSNIRRWFSQAPIALARAGKSMTARISLRALKSFLVASPKSVIYFIRNRAAAATGLESGITVNKGQLEVDIFFSGQALVMKLVVAVAFSAIVFGGIHCFGWSYMFPTPTETILWRISSVSITCYVVTILITFVVGRFLRSRTQTSPFLRQFHQPILDPALDLIDIVTATVYVAARIFILVEAFISLRHLPPGAVAAIEWTSFIPHI